MALARRREIYPVLAIASARPALWDQTDARGTARTTFAAEAKPERQHRRRRPHPANPMRLAFAATPFAVTVRPNRADSSAAISL